jgi:putative tryptophan/tyrosine transport system substrate-binding protein
VFFTGEDPVASGLVESLNRPGGNATGVTSMFGELAAKQVGLLHELVPGATLIAYLVNPSNPITERNVRDAVDAAQKLGEKIEIVHASSEVEIDAAFDTMRGMRASALLVQPDAFLVNKRIVALAARDALPAMYQTRELVAAGGLMSYGSSLAAMYRQMGVYVGKVLGGANPAELPVLQPTKFEMAINLKTAKALGLKLSDNLLSLADEVIE